MTEISDRLLKQRLRNRLIEVFDAFADEETVEVIGTDEIVELWYDYMDDERIEFYDEPVFTHEEIQAIKRFHNLVECCYPRVPGTWDLKDLEGCKEWSELVSNAKEEYAIFKKRGIFDEEHEVI